MSALSPRLGLIIARGNDYLMSAGFPLCLWWGQGGIHHGGGNIDLNIFSVCAALCWLPVAHQRHLSDAGKKKYAEFQTKNTACLDTVFNGTAWHMAPILKQINYIYYAFLCRLQGKGGLQTTVDLRKETAGLMRMLETAQCFMPCIHFFKDQHVVHIEKQE